MHFKTYKYKILKSTNDQAINFINCIKEKKESLSSGEKSLIDIKLVNDIWKKKFYEL